MEISSPLLNAGVGVEGARDVDCLEHLQFRRDWRLGGEVDGEVVGGARRAVRQAVPLDRLLASHRRVDDRHLVADTHPFARAAAVDGERALTMQRAEVDQHLYLAARRVPAHVGRVERLLRRNAFIAHLVHRGVVGDFLTRERTVVEPDRIEPPLEVVA